VSETWQILRDGGLPLAIEGSGQRPSQARLASAVRAAVAERPGGRDAEALAAFIFAWQQHWPKSFRTLLSDELLAWAQDQLPDDNRYLKLRRIALENLADIL